MRKSLIHLAAASLIAISMLAISACGSTSIVPWTNYPHLWPTAKAQPWLVILCKVNDNSTEPSGLSALANRFLTVGGGGQGNMADYYSDVSYGAISLLDTRVIGWYTAPFSTADLIGKGGRLAGPQYRGEVVKECANAVPEEDAGFGGYWGIIAVLNIVSGAGACDIGQHPMQIHGTNYNLGCIVFDPDSMFTAFAAHEIGHGYGLVHSFNDTGCEYCDAFDMMSALDTYRFAGANFPPSAETAADLSSHGGDFYDGPGLDVPNLLQLGWIPSNRIATYHIGDPKTTYTLTALSHPSGNQPLTVEAIGTDPNDIYTVEYRQDDGWDAGLPGNTVLIHEYKKTQSPWSYLILSNAQYAGEWLPGMTYNNLTLGLSVKVLSIDSGSGTATVELGLPQLFGSQPHIAIVAPSDGSSVAVNQPVKLVATATDFEGKTLPDSEVTWKVNGTPIGTGKIISTSFPTAGPQMITATATDRGESASQSITLNVLQATVGPSPTAGQPPTVQILSPTSGQNFILNGSGSATVTLASSASAGVVSYQWSDSLGLISDTQADDSVTINPTQAQAGCNMTTDTLTLTVTDNNNQSASTDVQFTIDRGCIQ
jgi:hypothetical protein